MLKSSIDLVQSARKAHEELFKLLRTASQAAAGTRELGEYADAAYAFKEAVDLLDDIKKEIASKQNLLESLMAQIAVQQSLIGPISTGYVKVSIKPLISVNLPGYKSDREGFDAVMQEMGVPEELWKGLERPIARIDYPAAAEYVTNILNSGERLPDKLRSLKRNQMVSTRYTAVKEIPYVQEERESTPQQPDENNDGDNFF
jgi:hypothetical protein